MLRRLLPTVVALGFGLLALGWGLVSLQRIFSQERDDARAQMRSRRQALEHTAAEALRQSLARQLAEKYTALRDAAADPLLADEGFYYVFNGIQTLPRVKRPSPGTQTPARRTYESLVLQLHYGPAPGPWGPRVTRLRAVEAALAAGKTRNAGALLDNLLHYHSDNRLPPVDELAFLLLVVERLERGPATPLLVRGLLRDGLPEDFGGFPREPGLQRDLLRERPNLTQADFDFLFERILRLSKRLGERTKDFEARARELSTGMLVVPDKLPEPILLGEQWYLQEGDERVYGVAVDVNTLLRPITEDLRARRIFDADGRFRLVRGGPVQALSTLRLEVDMPQWARAEADIEARYGLKTVLVAVCGALALAIFALSVLLQQRKYRFLELKSDFVATVSHELRTPLASIRLLGETLERKLAHTPEVRDYPTRIVQAADGLHFLVENILSFHRIDKGRWKLRPSRVRLEELVNPLRDDLASATATPVELTTDVGDAEMDADPTLLRLLFSNLGRNACAYNRRSPIRISITARMVPGHFCTVLVSDNGVGIPRAEWEKVFQDFYRLIHPGPEVHGSGLGLALCRKIMKLHGGDIQVATSGPEGTTFALTFIEPPR